MKQQPRKALAKVYCMDCHCPIEQGEPYFNLSNHIICMVCWAAPPAGGGK